MSRYGSLLRRRGCAAVGEQKVLQSWLTLDQTKSTVNPTLDILVFFYSPLSLHQRRTTPSPPRSPQRPCHLFPVAHVTRPQSRPPPNVPPHIPPSSSLCSPGGRRTAHQGPRHSLHIQAFPRRFTSPTSAPHPYTSPPPLAKAQACTAP